MTRRRYVVTYDIIDDRRRDRVHRCLLGFGDWVQQSVFICELDDREWVMLRAKLAACIDHLRDQVLVIDVGPASVDHHAVIRSIGRDYAAPIRVVVV